MKLNRQALPIAAALAAAYAALGQDASAACVGGPKIKGSFGATINGPVVGAATSEVFNGIITADGACKLTGSLTGGTFGAAFTTQAVTGTYSVPATGHTTLSLQLAGASAWSFDAGRIKDGTSVAIAGVAVSGPAVATLEMTAIAAKTYTLASLSGAYLSFCTGAGNSGSGGYGTELAYISFDGKGGFTVLAVGNNNGSPFSTTTPGTYQVAASGAFQLQDAGTFSRYSASGELVNNGTEVRAVLLDSTAGFGAYRSCLIRKAT